MKKSETFEFSKLSMEAKGDQVGKPKPAKELVPGLELQNEDADIEISNSTPLMLHKFHECLIQCFTSRNLSQSYKEF